MVIRKIFPALAGAAMLVMGGASMAADYRADEFLGLDLSKAILSPKPLGPPAEFAPVPLEAKGDIANVDGAKTDAVTRDAAKVDAAKVDTAKTDGAGSDAAKPGPAKSDVATIDHAAGPARASAEHKAASHRGAAIAHLGVEKPRGAARTKLAHRHGNPFNAQARDTRIQASRLQAHPNQPHPIQAWPCNSGGICDWRQ
jgi:hypothetical protein